MNILDTRALPARIHASRLRIRTAVVNGLVAAALAASQFQAVAAKDPGQTARDAMGLSTSTDPASQTRPVFSRPSPRLAPLQQAETETPTPTPTETLTETATEIPSEIATETPTETSTPEVTATPTETVTPTPDLTQTPTATPAPEVEDPVLALEAIPTEVAPGMSVVIRWRIEKPDLLPKDAPAVLQFHLPPSVELVDPSKTGIDPKTLSATIPTELTEDTLVFVLLPDASLPLEIKVELQQDGNVISAAAVELTLPKLEPEGASEGGMALLTEGVLVEFSHCQVPHPWVWCSTPVTVCTVGATLPGTSGMCTVTWDIANGTQWTFEGWTGYYIGLEATPDYTPVYHTSEVSHCMKGYFNETVNCTLQPILRGEQFNADEWMTIGPYTSGIAMKRVFYWTLDPTHWWVPSRSARSACSGSDGRECPLTNLANAQGEFKGDPINTYTGGLDFPVEDLSVATAGGPLVMERYYSSAATSAYTSPLGYGWAHNQDTRLIFSGMTGGESGVVWIKAHSTNQYAFLDNGNGTYTATGGVLATLTKNAGPPVTYTVKTVYQSTYIFNSTGRLTTWTDAQGHTWTYAYDGSSRLDLVTDSSGTRFLDLAYDAQGRLSTVVDQTGRGVTYGYNGSGDLSSVIDVRGETWSYTYDASHRLRLVTDPNGAVVMHTEYDSQGRAYQQYDPSGTLILQLTYNADGTTTVTDGLSHSDVDTFDSRRTLVSASNAQGGQLTKAYDDQLRPSSITDPNGNPTALTWSTNGANLTQIIDAEDGQGGLTYDSRNNLRQVTDARLAVTTYSFNENDPDPAKQTLLNSTTNALSQTTSFTYTTSADAPQPPGLLKTITDALDHTTSFTYNATGQRLTSTDALARTTEYTYDSLGRLKMTDDPAGRKNWTCYDPAGHVVRTVENASGDGGSPQTDPCDAGSYVPSGDPDEDRITTTVYDDGGRAIAMIDASGVITRTYFNSDNRPQYVVQNLTGQGIEVGTPPSYDPAYPDRNIRTQMVYDDNGNPIASIDTLGIITRTYYDSLDRPQYVVSNLVGQDIGVGTPPSFNPSYPDRNVRTRTYYDAAGNMIATEDNAGVITRTYYDGDNRPVTVVQNLTGQSISDPNPPARNPATPDENLRTDTTYDANGNAIATTDPAGVITRTYFDALNRPITVAQNLIGQGIGVGTPPTYNPAYPDRNLLTDTYYDDAGNAIATVDTLGVVTRTYYDDANRPVYVVRNLIGQGIYDSSPPAYTPAYPDRNVRTQTVYDDAGRSIASLDTLGHITRTYYDSLGRVRYMVQNLTGQGIEVGSPPAYNPAYPDQNVRSETVYDGDGDAIAALDNAGRITRTYFDDLHRAHYVTRNLTGQDISVGTPPTYNPAYPDRNVTTETIYSGTGAVVRSIDPLGKVNYSCYDGLQRVVKAIENPSVSSPCGSYTPSTDTDRDIITLATYDASGNRKTSTDPNGKVTTFAYDDVSRLVSETDPLSHATTYGYDIAGNRTSMTDARSVATNYEYDAVGRLTAVVENYRPGVTPDHEINVRTEYTYDGGGSRRTILDARSHTTTFTYDALGRLVTESDALSHMWTYGYDGLGNRISLLDANGATTSFSFDALSRPAGIDYPAPDADVAFTYDAAGNRHTMADGVGTTTWSYDDLDRPSAIQDPFSGTVSYGYDGAGHRTSLTYPDTKQVGYTYDLAGRLHLVTDWDSLVSTYTYDRGSRSATTTLPNALLTTYTFDDANRLTSLTHVRSGTTSASFAYTYDDVGNRLTAVENVAQPGTTPSLLWVGDSGNNRDLLFDVASVTDGENAVDLLGEYDASGGLLYTKSGVNDGPNVRGFNVPNETAIDTANHRLFVSDTSNNRVLVFNLDASNQLVDRLADNVLGQPDLTSSAASLTASGMYAPRGLVFQAGTNRLFVVDTGYNRVLVFDVAAISNGEAAVNVLGQTTLTAGSSGLAQNRLSGPQGALLSGDLLYVGDSTNNRVMVFDIASITNGENAVNLLGQYDAAGSPLYTKNGANDGPNVRGFNAPYDSVIDPTNHRLFVSDTSNNRVLVFNLDASNQLVDRVADNVLGQPNLTSSAASLTASGMSAPRGLALDLATNRLFVVNTSYHRVLVFDVAAITDGEAAVNVLGQATFTAGSSGLAQNRLNSPRGVALSGNLLFVGDTSNNRVMVFDVAAITNGENAVNVLGQTTFTTSTAATSQTGLSSPRGVVVDGSNRLFAADTTNNRIMVFDVASITDGEPAINVLGQATFTTSTAATTSTGLRAPEEVIAEGSTRLFVGDTSNHRIMVFDVAALANGEAAVNVLGQTTFTAGTAATAQGRLSSPAGVFLQSNLLYAADGGNHRLMVFDIAAITDGENAVNLTGQVDGSLQPVYTKAGVHDGPNAQGFSLSGALPDLALDPTGHRLFASDPVNNRVLVFNLDANNLLIDRIPDAVLGQTSFYSSTAAVTQSQFSSPRGLAFDPAGNRLFVADYTNNRVMVFDVASITNGENAVNVLGQATFTTSTAATTQAGLRNPAGLIFDQGTNLLYLADANNHRLMVFDVAAITNGENAVNGAGQLDASLAPTYTKNGIHDGPNTAGFNLSGAFASQAIDAVGHRLFSSDPTNHRVLVFNLTSANLLVDHVPDAVLGQADFTSGAAATAQNRLNSPRGLTYDPAGSRLFVVDYSNSRVMVFDVASITNGENAINVLGQTTFTASSGATAQNRLKNPVGASLDAGRGWLFVGDYANHRVMVFDVASITNGENAVSVLGQATFTTNTSATTQTGLKNPSGLTIEQATGRLFVADTNNHRVMVFDTTTITNGEPAVNVLGQATFTTATSATTQSGMKNPQGVEVDASASRLFVADTNNHRVTIFDVASITDGENAVHVLGQLNFTGGSSATSQGRMYAPMGVLVAPSSSVTATTIAYTYDPLYRLTAADYNGGTSYFHYTYDATGNRLTEVTQAGTTTYVYDDANRLTSVGGVTYTWDSNGNLLSDGASTYTYDHADRLGTAVQGGTTYTYGYSGLGDRLRQTVNGTPTSYTLDLAAGLTHVLTDGTNAYLYGTSRIGEEQPGGWRYHVGDALGSVRQLVDSAGDVALAKSYAPFGSALTTAGTGTSAFAFAGEQADAMGLVYLRARYLSTAQGRFLSRDTWEGDPNQPMSHNAWLYGYANPTRNTDPSGRWPIDDEDGDGKLDDGWRCDYCFYTDPNPDGIKPLDPDLKVSYDLGKAFYERLRDDKSGWWQSLREDVLCSSAPLMRMALALLYAAEGTGGVNRALALGAYDKGWAEGFDEAFGRRYWWRRNEYGRAGEYAFLGGQDSARRRTSSAVPIPNDIAVFPQAFMYDIPGILNGEYSTGILDHRPWNWGDIVRADWVAPRFRMEMDRHFVSFEHDQLRGKSDAIGKEDKRIWYVRINSFIITPKQQDYWCGVDQSCIG